MKSLRFFLLCILGLLIFVTIFRYNSIAQQNVGIGTTTPNSSAILDLTAADKGLLVPRVTLNNANNPAPVTGPAEGLLIFNATGTEPHGFWYWNGTQWVQVGAGGGNAWNLLGNAGITNPANPAIYGTSTIGISENWIGTTDTKDFVIGTNNIERMRVKQTTGNIGFGTAAPGYPLHGLGNNAASVAVISNSNAAGIGLTGQNIAASGTGSGNGVFGATVQSNGFGVYGANLNTNGTGILGIGNNVSTYTLVSGGSGGAFFATLTGIYGYAANNTGYGVYGKAVNAASAYGVVGIANNVVGAGPTFGAGGAFSGYNYGVSGVQTNNLAGVQTAAGYFVGDPTAPSTTLVEAWSTAGTHYKIWQSPQGTVATCIPDLNGNPVTLHAIETPEFYFQDYGQGKLVNGKAHIDIDPILAKNIIVNEKHPLRVFIQLEDNENCKGVIVKNKTVNSFEVVELNGGVSNTPFQWFITCNVADVMIGKRLSKFADLRFEPGPVNVTVPLRNDSFESEKDVKKK
ncbi:MAG: hypothetical protein HY958_14815 [Bacteroidia bacterium]|nr:hypothetical protein [Bacteroidia bacterium]